MFFLGSIFILFTIVWILALGFFSPLGLFAGFIFGKIYGVIFLISGTAVGATLLYLFANYFVKDMIRDKFLSKFKNLETKIFNYNLNYIEKIRIFFYLFFNDISDIYILAPKNFY